MRKWLAGYELGKMKKIHCLNYFLISMMKHLAKQLQGERVYFHLQFQRDTAHPGREILVEGREGMVAGTGDCASHLSPILRM